VIEPVSASASPDLLADLDRRLRSARREFGPTNTLTSALLHLRAALLIHRAALANDAEAHLFLETLAELSELAFGCASVRLMDPQTCPEKLPHFAFPVESYSEVLANASRVFRTAIHDSLLPLDSHRDLFNRFIYVVGPRLEWRYCSIPQNLTDILLGNHDTSEFPFHPVLADDLELTATCAGEVSFLWGEGEDAPRVLLVNNISGHFRPTWRSTDLDGLIRRALRLRGQTSVLSMANDGWCVSGPLGTTLSRASGRAVHPDYPFEVNGNGVAT
jgi:hypothetical protein